jgi:uncharacterized protein
MDTNASLGPAPVSQSERIVLIDSLRGIAILGILLMNIPYFGLADPSASNIEVNHEIGTINEQVWYIINLIFDGTQRALFSMLFGTGIMLFISHLEKRTTGMAPAEYFLRRQLWLLVFGLIDGYVLLWNGDILFGYAVCGIVVFAFRKLKPKDLLIAAGVCLVFMTMRDNLDLYRNKFSIQKGEKISLLDTTKVKLTDQQKDQLEAMKDLKEKADSAAMQKDLARNLRQVRGGFADLYENVSNVTYHIEIVEVYNGIWDVLIFMLIGVAFFKTGIMTGEAPTKIYWWLFLVGMVPGLYLTHVYLQLNYRGHFMWYGYSKIVSFDIYQISRALRSIGFFGLIMLIYKSGWFKWLFALTRPVGQMAFTNYLMQSILCGFYFYGIGLGMYGKLQRYQIYYVVGVVWVIEIIWSHIWLKYFRFGPFEWLWRSLTYWKKQPMRRA